MLMFEWGKMVIWSCKHPTVRIDVKRTMRYVYFNNKKIWTWISMHILLDKNIRQRTLN